MIVPNYVPDPLEVPNNVTTEPYRFRLVFVRRVMLLYLGSIGVLALLTRADWPTQGVGPVALFFAALLIALDLWRIGARGTKLEAIISTAALPLVVAVGAWLVEELMRVGYPAWSPAIGIVSACLYSAVCGRDFSFVGCYFLAFIASSVFIAWRVVVEGMSAHTAAFALIANAGYLLYFLYDLASLMARRRRGEEGAAVVDLYRDVFNLGGYAVRCVRHWRKHRIWEIAR